jgi:hypothetical protein
MNKNQKGFLIVLGIVFWCMIGMAACLNAIFDHGLVAQLIPIPFIALPIVFAYIALGKDKR